MAMFNGGPLDGYLSMDEELGDIPEGQPGSEPGASPGGFPPAGGARDSGGFDLEAMSEMEKFDLLMNVARSLLSGELTQQDKLLMEKATTLMQQIRANEEKDEEAAMGGKFTPRVMKKAYGNGPR